MIAVADTDRSLPMSVKVAYGFPGASYFIAFNVLGLYLIWFFTDTVGFSPAFAGVIASTSERTVDSLIGSSAAYLEQMLTADCGRTGERLLRHPLVEGTRPP